MVGVMLYFSQALNSAALPGSLYVNNAMNGVSKILATAICSILLLYYDRRTILSGSFFLISICCFSSMLFQRIGEQYENHYSYGKAKLKFHQILNLKFLFRFHTSGTMDFFCWNGGRWGSVCWYVELPFLF